jgi:hypothetical protein
VYVETDSYLASLSDADLEQPLDLSQIGLGPQTVASTLTLLLLNHIGTETGELLASKACRAHAGIRSDRAAASGLSRLLAWPSPGAHLDTDRIRYYRGK